MTRRLKQVFAYCDQIKKNKIISNTYTKKAVNRFLDDYKNKNESWLYWFDEELFNEVIEFVESLELPDTKQKIKLLPWQLFIYANLYGFVYKDNHNRRRFRQAYIEVARKNGKTSAFLYPMILYDFLSTNAAESYMFSSSIDQSEKAFIETKSIINNNPELDALTNCFSNSITLKQDISRISFFTAESSSLDSYRNSLTILDEFWNYSTDKPLTAARYGGRARLNNLVVVITSAGFDISSPCYAENNKCKSILNKSIVDDSYFGIIYSYDDKDDWKEPSNFIKANPSLGEFLKADVLQSDLQDALITPSHQLDFKSKTCGIWSNSVSNWLPLDIIERDQPTINYDDLIGLPCYGALDLSSVQDLTVFTLIWKKGNNFIYKHRFYIPENQLLNKYKLDNINFIDWVNRGLVQTTKGNTIDYDFIYNDIVADYQKFNFNEIAFDKWNSNYLINKLNDTLPQIDYIDFEQNLKKFSQPTKDFEKEFLNGNIIENNPVAKWCLANAVIKPDENNNYKPLKEFKQSTKRIDSVITSIMSLSRLKANQQQQKKKISFEDVFNSF